MVSKLMSWGLKQARYSEGRERKEASEHLKWAEKEFREGGISSNRYKMLKKFWRGQLEGLKQPLKDRAKLEINILKARSKYDVGDQEKLIKMTRPPMKFKGWVIGRKLIDDDGKRRNFTYYPRSVMGQPPYHFRTKTQALKRLKNLEKKEKFPATERNVSVFKFTPRTYLDRY